MQRQGAAEVYTFNDAGLPSTCGVNPLQAAIGCLNQAAAHRPDLIVVEFGDGLLGDYGVDTILADHQVSSVISALVLAAPDPVAAWGGIQLLSGWGLATSVVTGQSTDNEAGVDAIHRHTGVAAINARAQSAAFVEEVLGQALPGTVSQDASMTRKRVGVVGACGYVGRELVRWILLHPQLQLHSVFSRSRAGQPYASAAPELMGFVDLVLEPIPQQFDGLDVLLATPHGAAAELIPLTSEIPLVIDLSRDHRHVEGWVYGQPEWRREGARRRKTNLGTRLFCYRTFLRLCSFGCRKCADRTSACLCSHRFNWIGASPSHTTHHPERFSNLRAYKVFQHQHVPEIQSFLNHLGASPALDFVPLSAPIDRGILPPSLPMSKLMSMQRCSLNRPMPRSRSFACVREAPICARFGALHWQISPYIKITQPSLCWWRSITLAKALLLKPFRP